MLATNRNTSTEDQMAAKKTTPGKGPRHGGRKPTSPGPMSSKVKNLTEARGMKQMDLVRATGIDQATISRLMRLGQRPNWEEAVRLAEALDVTLDYLVDDGRPETTDLARLSAEREIAMSLRDPAVHPDLGHLARELELIREIGIEEATRRILMIAATTPGYRETTPEPPPVTPEERTPAPAGGEGSTYRQQKEDAAKKPRLFGGGGFKRKRYPFKG